MLCIRSLVQGTGAHLTSPQQRCDGKRPCTTCVNGERDAGCTYEPRPRSRRASANAPLFPRNHSPRPLSIRTLPSRPSTIGVLFSEETLPSLGSPLLAWSKSSGSDPPLPEPLTHPSGVTLFALSNHRESAPSPYPPPPLAPHKRSLAPSSHVHSAGSLGPSSVVPAALGAYDTAECVPHPDVSIPHGSPVDSFPNHTAAPPDPVIAHPPGARADFPHRRG